MILVGKLNRSYRNEKNIFRNVRGCYQGFERVDISNDLLSLTNQYINKQLNNRGSKND